MLVEIQAKELETKIAMQESIFLYVYTPLCGTCKVAEQMTNIATEVKQQTVFKTNINFIEPFAHAWEVESVPCLLKLNGKTLEKKLYRFESVPNVLSFIKN